MPVTYLEIENFKSYAGKQTVGPFRDFTSVIGPNGSGKSNLMDAMSFVLGVQSRDLRSSQMKDLIFRPPGTNVHRQTLRACVTLYFQPKNKDNDDDEDSSSNDDNDNGDQEIAFARAISPNGHGEYLVNGKTVTFAKYEERLAEIGVLVKVRNFLVFQGDVESIARKSPRDMVLMLEEISQSIAFRDEYDNALKAKEDADAAVLFENNRQKGLRSERRRLKEQKDEAERFQDMLDQKAKLQTDLYLWQLYHIDYDIKEQEETIKEMEHELEEKQQGEEELAEALKEAKKKASAARRKTQNVDKTRVKCAAAVDKLEPQMIQCTEEIKNLEKKISAAEKQLTKKQKEASNHQGNLEQINEQVEEQRKKLEQLEKDYEEIKKDAVAGGDDSNNQVSLTEEQEEELERIKQAAAAATVQPRRTLADLKRRLNRERAQVANAQQELEDAKKTLAQTKSEAAAAMERKEKLSASIDSTKTTIEEKKKELLEAQQALQQSQARRDELDQEIEKINKTLRDAKDSRRKSRDEERLTQAIAALKRHFPGVHGRLVDLCRPTQRKFNLAITVAAGKDMDAIVVDTKETGFECIRHLREERVGVGTFLPLDSLQVPSVESQERARSLAAQDPRYRLAADIITCEDTYKPAVLYAVGNTVVCDDLDCARELCFGRGGAAGGSGLKAVTLGGAVISKAGTMTGGVTNEDNNQAGRWGAAEIEKLREKKEQLENERSELDTATESHGRRSGRRQGGSLSRGSLIDELDNNLKTLESRNQFASGDLAYADKTLRDKNLQIKELEKQVKKLEDTIAKTESSISELADKVEKAKEDVKNIEEEHFGPFREKTGLKDFKAYEDAVGERRKEFNEQRRQLMEHITQLEQQKDYETNRDFTKPIANLEKRIKENKAKLKTAKAKASKLETQLEEAKEELESAEAAVKEASDEEKSFDEAVQAAQSEYSDAQAERHKTSKSVTAGIAAVERLRGTLHETLQKARVEEVELPMLDDDGNKMEADSDDEEDNGGTQSQTSKRGSNSLTQDSGGIPHFSQPENPKVVKDKRAVANIDYSQLDDELKERPSDREEKRMKKEFEDKLNKLTIAIESAAPNMKAAEAFENMTAKLKDTTTDHDKAKEDARKAAAAFQKVKSQRAKLFNEAFTHIDESLKTIYTDMTKSSKHPLGGNAYLSLDETEEPYKGGMKFNAMPPMKRFRDMEQLSGGEKTVAALSLLFAIHSYHPAPFFVMDEVDAALDNINLRKVCNYISRRSKTDFQCIVISLKDMFFERSQSLVGVCRDVGTSSSRTLTLDLTAFDKEEEPAPRKRGAKRKAKSVGEADSPKRSTRSSRRKSADDE